MTKKIVGTCGNCGGNVTVPMVWHGIYPPKPSCDSCGASPKRDKAEILDMEPRPARLPGKKWESLEDLTSHLNGWARDRLKYLG